VKLADANEFRWGIERRLEFIEFRLFWEGGINRSDIVEEFGVSVPQASKDLALYQIQAPSNILYDRRQKRYFASEAFRPKFISLDAHAYLDHLTEKTKSLHAEKAAPMEGSFQAYKLPIPQRRIEPEVLRALLACIRMNQSIEVLYQSMGEKRPEPLWRRISPHAFSSDGLRWHVRAFCHIDYKFKDFIISRCIQTRSPGAAEALSSDDELWIKYFPVVLCPNPRLTDNQQRVIAGDFAMEKGEVVVAVRQAMLYYFSKRLRLDVADRFDNPSETPIIVKNRNEFDLALLEAMR
jgi:predicted DNA-binding transcriptional regulator YafY